MLVKLMLEQRLVVGRRSSARSIVVLGQETDELIGAVLCRSRQPRTRGLSDAWASLIIISQESSASLSI